MVDPNSPSTLSSIERVLKDMTPYPEDFKGTVYSEGEVESDIGRLKSFKNSPFYNKAEERSDAKLLEITFTDMVEMDDWFSEDKSYGDDPDWLALTTFPTSEIDDVFNHIDMIGVFSNELTGHKTLPFAVDLTYNTDHDDIAKKFRWRHVYGKKKDIPEQVSEFDRSLSLRNRYGLKIPGFTSAKYCEDKNTLNVDEKPMFEKGRIQVMPRFVVGYSQDLAERLADKDSLPEDKYNGARLCAKWCALIELKEQATDIRQMLDNLTEEEIKYMNQEELVVAKKSIIAMERYINNAYNEAKKLADTDAGEKAAMEYAMNRDTVVQAIINQSQNTFLGKDWQRVA